MSAFVTIECDSCGERYEGSHGQDLGEVRADARSMDGWRHPGLSLGDQVDRDFCPNHTFSASGEPS